ncbi:hypothetical protein HERIO_625 [Hepatospora eriocheir]|uniref:Uncharacterized protein n=1 Tax=Hepatospora eriocheir TaxID=1081669 RepID=A0A1X0QCJ6_9MICR|nr:hypothetical protein HERIO_625 [Hepatospora eriocheir]
MTETREEVITKLINQLNDSTYEDDKIDALTNIYVMALEFPTLILNHFNDILANTFSLEHREFQYKILRIISAFSDELVIDKETTVILFTANAYEVGSVLNLFYSEKIFRELIKFEGVIPFVLNLARIGPFKIFKRFLILDAKFNEKLCITGLFEVLVCKPIKYEKLTLIKKLMNESLVNSEYFVMKQYHKELIELFDFQLFCLCLDTMIPGVKTDFEIQKLLYKAITDQEYEFLYKMSDNNTKILNFLIKSLNYDELVDSVDSSYFGASLLELIILKDPSKINPNQSILTNLLLNLNGIDCEQLNVFRNNLELNEVKLCYLIFFVADITQYYDLLLEKLLQYNFFKDTDNITFQLLVLLLNLHNKRQNLTNEQIIYLLRKLRIKCEHCVFSRQIDGILSTTISEVINEMEKLIRDELLSTNNSDEIIDKTYSKSVKPEEKQIEPDNSMFDINDYEKINNGLQYLFKFFKR